MDALIAPGGSLEILSRREINQLRDTGEGGLYEVWRRCSLAVLASADEDDDVRRILKQHERFRLAIVQRQWGVELELENAPESAFVDGKMIRGIRELLFAVLRDVLYTHDEIMRSERFDLSNSASITDAVFHILRNAQVLKPGLEPKLIVCWGGHAISRTEYDYSKAVGYQLGLRGLDICTGCGAGAMKGPMKGAAVGHGKQRITKGRYVGISEPTIIAAESPNPVVRDLVIMPDMEKRLEAFVRLAHSIVIFPGGVGTAEEILYLLGVLLSPRNQDICLPVILTGPASSRGYFELLDRFVADTLGEPAKRLYRIVLDDPQQVAREVQAGLVEVQRRRIETEDAYLFNWQIEIPQALQEPFEATHEAMAALELSADQPAAALATNLRRAFSGIVAGNVREAGIKRVEEHGPFELRGDPQVLAMLDRLLREFVAARRMKLTDPASYKPCFRIAA